MITTVTCVPVFHGSHVSLHRGYEDPGDAVGTEEERLDVFRRVCMAVRERVQQFASIATGAATAGQSA